MNILVVNEPNVKVIFKPEWYGLNYPKQTNSAGWKFYSIDKNKKIDQITSQSCFDFIFPTLVAVTLEQYNNWSNLRLFALNCWIYTYG